MCCKEGGREYSYIFTILGLDLSIEDLLNGGEERTTGTGVGEIDGDDGEEESVKKNQVNDHVHLKWEKKKWN